MIRLVVFIIILLSSATSNERENIINLLEAERKSRLLNLIEVYNNLETTYFVMLNFTIIYFSFYLEKLTRK